MPVSRSASREPGSRTLCNAVVGLGLAALAGGLLQAEPPSPAPQAQQESVRLDRFFEARRLRDRGNLAEAIALAEKLLAQDREQPGDGRAQVAESLQFLAELQEEHEDFAAARAARKEVLSLQGQLHGEQDWRVTDARLALAHTNRLARVGPAGQRLLAEAEEHGERAFAYFKDKKYPEAIQEQRRVVKLRRQVLGPRSPEYASGVYGLARLSELADDYATAETYYRQVLEIRAENCGEAHPLLASTRRTAAEFLEGRVTAALNKKDYPAARDRLQELVEIYTRLYGAGDRRVDESRQTFEQVRALCLAAQAKRDDLPEKDRLAADCEFLAFLAEQYMRSGDFASGKKVAQKILELRLKIHGEKHWQVTDARQSLDYVELQTRLAKDDLRRLGEARRLNRQVDLLVQEQKFGAAQAAAEKALAIRKELLGDKNLDTAVSLGNLASVYFYRKDYARAEELYKQALAADREAIGDDHPGLITGLHNLGLLYHAQKDYVRAEPVYRQAVELVRRTRGPGDPDYLSALDLLAELCRSVGDYPRAEPLYREAASLVRDKVGEKHRDYATRLHNLAKVYEAMGDYGQAETRLRQAADVFRDVLGDGHPDYATALDSLGALCQRKGDLEQAQRLFEQSLEILQDALGEDHPNNVGPLTHLALLSKVKGNYAQAERLYLRALALQRQARGEKNSEYATGLDNLANLYEETGDFARAEKLHVQALAIYKDTLGARSRDYVICLNNLANTYEGRGDYPRAERLYREILDLKEGLWGKKHPDYATGLDNLAGLYCTMGDYARAEPLRRQALAIYREALGPKHPDYAVALANLATLYSQMSKNDLAVLLQQDAVELTREIYGDKHPDYARRLNSLAALYDLAGQPQRAEPLYPRALAALEASVGKQHPLYASALNNQAMLYESMGAPERAVPLLRQALAMKEEAFGKAHPDYVNCLHNLAVVYAALGQPGQGLPLARQALTTARDQMELVAAVQSQRQQLAAAEKYRVYLDGYLSLSALARASAEEVYAEVLRWKGAVSARQQFMRRLRRAPAADPRVAKLYEELTAATGRLAALSHASPAPQHPDQLRRDMEQLVNRIERLEHDLADASAAFRKEFRQGRRTVAEVRAALPDDAVLVDFLEYGQYQPPAAGRPKGSGVSHLAAFVIRRESVVRVDLGPAKEVREALGSWRLALQRRFRTEGDSKPGAEVRKLLWQPLEEHAKGARLVLVSPDGALARVPFAALPGSKKDSYLLEEVAVAVVPVPQLLPDLLAPRPDEPQAEPSLLLVGDVRYDAAPGSAAVASGPAAARGSDDAVFRWPALANTRAEVTAIADAFRRHPGHGGVAELLDDQATESAVRRSAPAHRYLHFATHGYFAPPQLCSALAEASRSREPEAFSLFETRGVAGFHPGLLSGLVLAGANRPVQAGQDDGILTALEVEALDLSSVELATLSACETGLGEEAGGEGLLGLQRAFQLAGARSAVAGLWQVDDAATRQFMATFYANLWDKKLPKLEALRQAQRWMLTEGDGWMRQQGISRGVTDVRVPKERLPVEDGRLPPYYWAAFSLSGDWR